MRWRWAHINLKVFAEGGVFVFPSREMMHFSLSPETAICPLGFEGKGGMMRAQVSPEQKARNCEGCQEGLPSASWESTLCHLEKEAASHSCTFFIVSFKTPQ